MSRLVIKPFLFKDEVDIVEIQLEELYDVVDYFIIVETQKSFQGYNRENFPIFEKNIDRFTKYKDKIVYCKFEEDKYPPDYTMTSSQQRRNFNYELVRQIVKELNFPSDTVVIYGDCDEVPRKEVIEQIKTGGIYVDESTVINLQMYLYYFYFNYRCDTVKWNGLKLVGLPTYLSIDNVYEQLRCLHDHTTLPTLLNCGWHYSYFGDIDFVINKLNTTCDGTSLRNDARIMNRENIADAMKTGRDVYFRSEHRWQILPIDGLDLPRGVKNNPQKYKQFFHE